MMVSAERAAGMAAARAEESMAMVVGKAWMMVAAAMAVAAAAAGQTAGGLDLDLAEGVETMTAAAKARLMAAAREVDAMAVAEEHSKRPR